MDSDHLKVFLRCAVCSRDLDALSLKHRPERVACDCGRVYRFHNNCLDMLPEEEADKFQTDHLPKWDTSSDLGIRTSYGPNQLSRRSAPRLIETIDKLAPRSVPRSILDVGMGVITKGKIRKHYENVNRYFQLYVGLDPSKYQCELASEDTDRSLFIRGVGENIPLQDDQFDVSLILSTLDHCTFPEKVKSEVLRVLRPGGLVLIYLNNDKSWFKLVLKRKANEVREKASFDHSWFFSPEDVAELLGPEFEILREYDAQYLPLDYYTRNKILGKIYLGFLLLFDALGSALLPRRGRTFLIVARKRSD